MRKCSQRRVGAFNVAGTTQRIDDQRCHFAVAVGCLVSYLQDPFGCGKIALRNLHLRQLDILHPEFRLQFQYAMLAVCGLIKPSRIQQKHAFECGDVPHWIDVACGNDSCSVMLMFETAKLVNDDWIKISGQIYEVAYSAF